MTLHRRPIIGIMGAGEPGPESKRLARRLGQLVAEAGWILLTGGRPAGIMEAAGAGAKAVPGGLTIGILPSGRDGPVSEYVDVAVFTGLGDARNVVNVLTSDVVVACGVEGPGTASEVALALKAGRPTVLVCASPAASTFFATIVRGERLYQVDSAEAAIELIEQRLGIPRWAAK